MTFTYQGYERILSLLQGNGYEIADYHNWKSYKQCAILRHDIDYSLQEAVAMASLEASKGVRSTWFVLLTSDFYNVFSKRSADMLKQIMSMGHTIGLHFDEVRYTEMLRQTDNAVSNLGTNQECLSQLIGFIQEEAYLLGRAIGEKIDVVSMHRPGKAVLDADLQIPGIVNSYSQTFFKEFKYVSDSRRHWREPVEDIIAEIKGGNKRLHILTHAFWYHDTEEDITETVRSFINKGNADRYTSMMENITDLSSILPYKQVLQE